MPLQSKVALPKLVNAAQIAINNTLLDDEIAGLVALYGYTTARMQAAQQLCDTTVQTVNAQFSAAGAQRQATQQVRAAEQQAYQRYQALAKVARALFGNQSAQCITLGLVGSAPKTTAGFTAAATALFDNALVQPAIAAVLALHGFDVARIDDGRAAVLAFAQASRAQVAAIGTAQQATREQQQALDVLKRWFAQYMKIARVALVEKPQLVEKLGGIARSSRTAAQRAAPRKAAATRKAKQTAA